MRPDCHIEAHKTENMDGAALLPLICDASGPPIVNLLPQIITGATWRKVKSTQRAFEHVVLKSCQTSMPHNPIHYPRVDLCARMLDWLVRRESPTWSTLALGRGCSASAVANSMRTHRWAAVSAKSQQLKKHHAWPACHSAVLPGPDNLGNALVADWPGAVIKPTGGRQGSAASGMRNESPSSAVAVSTHIRMGQVFARVT